MGASGKETQFLKSSIAVQVLLGICIAVLFFEWTPLAGAIRTGELTSSDRSGAEEYLYFYKDIVAGKNNGLYEQNNDRTETGAMSTINVGMVQPFVPQDNSKERSPRNYSDLSIGPCNAHQDLPYT